MLLWVSRFCDARVAGQLRRIGELSPYFSFNTMKHLPKFMTSDLFST